MKTEAIEAVTGRWSDRIVRLREAYIPSRNSHFNHIVNNLICPMGLTDEHEWQDSETRRSFVSAMRNLRTYLRLIAQNPDFRDKEMKTNDGYFPEGPTITISPYVVYAASNLAA